MIVGGAMETVSIIGASRLETFTITGTAKNVEVSGTDISEMVLGHTAGKVGATVATAKNGYLRIKDNDALTSVVADSIDDVIELTIKGNADLASVSFAALNSVGTATAAIVEISGNELVIDNIQQPSASGEVPVVAKSIESADFGPLAIYIAAAKAKVGTTGKIVVTADEVTKVTSKTGSDVTPTDDDKIIANYIPATIVSANDGEAAVAKVQELWVSAMESGAYNKVAITQAGISSLVTRTGNDIYYDLLNWSNEASVKSTFSAAGVTVSVGKGRYEGSYEATVFSPTSGYTFVMNVGGEKFTHTSTSLESGDEIVDTLFDLWSKTAKAVTETETYAVDNSTTGKIVLTGKAKGSSASTFSLPSMMAYLDAAGTTAVTSTWITPTTNAVARVTDEAYIQLAYAGSVGNTLTATTLSMTSSNLAVSGTDESISATGDDNTGVKAYIAKVAQSSASADAVKDASVYRVADLVTSAS